MSWFPWSVPDEALYFVEEQFERFGAPKPPNQALDDGIAFVINYVVANNYFAPSTEDACRRYENPGLTEPEKYSILGPLEALIKMKRGIRNISFDQLHLLAWSTLLFCWSEDAEEVIQWWRKYEMEGVIRDKLAVTAL